MIHPRRLILVSLILIVQLASGCGRSEDSANTAPAPSNAANVAIEQTKANGNREELGMKINNFEWETEDLAWRADDQKRTLTAAFRLLPDDVRKLSESLASKGPGAPRSVPVEEWFPAELVAQGESTGASAVEGTAYPADDFFHQPYNQGTITRISDTDYFVIELNSK